MKPSTIEARGVATRSNQAKPGGAATGPPRGMHRAEAALRVEIREQTAEIPLVGAVAVNEEEEPCGARRGDDVRDEFHGGQPTAARAA